MNKIILVDFDGVIHSYTSGWQGIDVIPDLPVPGTFDWLRDHLPPLSMGVYRRYKGLEAQIYSARSKYAEGIDAMRVWFIKHGMEREYFMRDLLKFPAKKPAAFITIDDRAICFNGIFPTDEEILNFKPWYKRE